MRLSIDHYGDRLKVALEWDARGWRAWRPRGEYGRQAYSRFWFVGARWLGVGFVMQWHDKTQADRMRL